MDTKLYKWEEEKKQVNMQENDINIISEEQKQQENLYMPVEKLSDKKRDRVRKNMPEGISVFSERQNLIRTGKYRFLDSSGKIHNASRTTPSSKYMKPILDALKEIDINLSRRFDPMMENEVHDSFLTAIRACEKYLDNRNPWTSEGKARKQMVQDFYAQLREESMKLENRISELKERGELPEISNNIDETMEDNGGLTWYDLLKDVRTAKYTNGEKGVKISKGGAGTSDVYIIESNGKKKFFKENEKTSHGNFFIMLDESADHLESDAEEIENKESVAKAKKRAKLLRSIKEGMGTVFANNLEYVVRFMKDIENGEEFIESLKGEVVLPETVRQDLQGLVDEYEALNEELDSLRDQVVKYSGNRESEEYKSIMDRAQQKLKEVEECDYSFIVREIGRLRKAFFSDRISSNSAKIEEGEELSKRNVATSRLARILGISNLLAKSELATVTVDGKTMTGTIMEQAKGVEAFKVIRSNRFKNKKVRYSGNAFKDLTSLQVFDLICGQVDRHFSNYMVTTEEKDGVVYFKNIQGIDNDMSFGLLKYKDVHEREMYGYNRIRNIECNGKMSLPFMDKDLATKIMAINVDVLDYQMSDILSKSERKALTARIKSVKKVIEKQFAYEAKLRRKRVKFNSRFVDSKADSKAWDKAMEIYKQKMVKLNEKDPKYAGDYIDGTTYLHKDLVVG